MHTIIYLDIVRELLDLGLPDAFRVRAGRLQHHFLPVGHGLPVEKEQGGLRATSTAAGEQYCSTIVGVI